MWKDYSISYIKANRSSGISIIAAALISSLFLSFLCCFFFNLWTSDIDNIIRNEGDWQGRISGITDESSLSVITSFANVEKAVINTELSDGKNLVADIYFYNTRTIYQDIPLITANLGMTEASASYNFRLLSKYFVHDPKDESPPMLMGFYLAVLLLASFSLIMIIHNSFAISMRARIHQFGIFSSIGATPKQIQICLLQEAMTLCLIPILLGNLLGIAAGYILLQAMDILAKAIPGAYVSAFAYHPAVFLITFFSSALTVLFSAWIPARKLSRLTPLEAIRSVSDLHLKKKKSSPILSFLFGIEGELAGNALKAQRKALRTSTLSLTLSFLSFTIILSFFTLSGISTRHTYFERYQNVWDIMATVKNTDIRNFEASQKLSSLKGIEDCVVYQKAAAKGLTLGDWQSDELTALGGLETLSGSSKAAIPLVILDDESFADYCKAIGITPQLNGTIILNHIWDSINSNFRYPKYIPFVKETRDTITLCETELPILAYTQEVPVLRESYPDYALVQFISLSAWQKISPQIETDKTEQNTYIRFLTEEGLSLSETKKLENSVLQLIGNQFEPEIENRIEEKLINDKMILGYLLVVGGICALLAIIGIANLFSNTMGFLTQRKREFARYVSVGMTPESMRKMFFAEALVIAGRPLLITLPLTILFVQFAAAASYLNPKEFWVEAPFLPVAIFCLFIFAFVALAYYIGGKRLLHCDLNEALRNDIMS